MLRGWWAFSSPDPFVLRDRERMRGWVMGVKAGLRDSGARSADAEAGGPFSFCHPEPWMDLCWPYTHFLGSPSLNPGLQMKTLPRLLGGTRWTRL